MRQHRFTRSDRLLNARDYSNVFANASRASNRYFTILRRSNGLAHPRLGLVVAKKNIKKAVQRNRVKRAIRESFRLNKPALPKQDFVVLVKASAADADSKMLRIAWEKLAIHGEKCATY
ncbi:MAG: ribonuclease P protein component [Methylococcaceae bacterium]|nr:MAG: ribonuclease P protein component [Methylococcaceae bacterium]